MSEKNSVEEIYIISARKIRTSLPKFILFIGMAYVVWLVGTTFFIPLSQGAFIGAVEAIRLDSLIMLASVIILIIASFIEMRNLADGCAGMFSSFVVRRGSKVENIRFIQLRRSFRNIGYVIPFTVTSLIFSGLFEQIHPWLNTIIAVIIAIWIVVAATLLAMVLGLEIEESARLFAERVERRIRKLSERKVKKK